MSGKQQMLLLADGYPKNIQLTFFGLVTKIKIWIMLKNIILLKYEKFLNQEEWAAGIKVSQIVNS